MSRSRCRVDSCETSTRIAVLLDENVDDIAILVDGAIEILLFPTNANEHLVHMPGIPIPIIPATQSSCISRPEFRAPSPNGLIGDRHDPFGEKILNIAKAKGESAVQPHGVLDDGRRGTVALIQEIECFHHCSVRQPT